MWLRKLYHSYRKKQEILINFLPICAAWIIINLIEHAYGELVTFRFLHLHIYMELIRLEMNG